ncbi:MAG TPA: ATP-dependent Clp protease proteolytic subunit, partial [Rubrobacteraceae bacterium]|nr:ATP-dependent Clp protease proteolytic subunit [Rubrobacteraceae bacterium]
MARIDGEIDQQTAEYVGRVISDAEDTDAQAVVVTLDTPGGRLDSTQEIVEDMSGAKETPVITYVTPQGARAASAGTFIMMGSDVAAMALQTRLGAATPVDAFGQDIPGDMGEKVTNDAAAFISGLAEAHGRNEVWAESAVREAQALDASDARRKGVVEYVQPDLRSVLQAADGATVQPKDLTLQTAKAAIVQKPLSFKERFGIPLYALVIPLVIVILLGAGAVFAAFRSRRWRAMTGREGMIGEIGTVRRRISDSTGGMV